MLEILAAGAGAAVGEIVCKRRLLKGLLERQREPSIWSIRYVTAPIGLSAPTYGEGSNTGARFARLTLSNLRHQYTDRGPPPLRAWRCHAVPQAPRRCLRRMGGAIQPKFVLKIADTALGAARNLNAPMSGVCPVRRQQRWSSTGAAAVAAFNKGEPGTGIGSKAPIAPFDIRWAGPGTDCRWGMPRQSAQQHCRWETIGDDLLKVYEELLAEPLQQLSTAHGIGAAAFGG